MGSALVATAFTCSLPAPASAQTPADASAQVSVRTLVDSVRPYLVFAPLGESWFVAASRGKRMLLDIGRIDLDLGKDSTLLAAFREATAAQTPVPVGTFFLVRGPWGEERAQATNVDTWNGRIVLVLQGSVAMDSASQREGIIASALREPTNARDRIAATRGRAVSFAVVDTLGSVRPTARVPVAKCSRGPVTGPLFDRLKLLRDSLAGVLRAEGQPPYERLARSLSVSSSHVKGCFGVPGVVLAVSLRAGVGTEWTRQRVVLVDSLGHAERLVVEDLRFRVHDLLAAMDFDGDGVDDLATLGRTHLARGTTLLRYDAKGRRFVRLAGGFMREDR